MEVMRSDEMEVLEDMGKKLDEKVKQEMVPLLSDKE